MKRILFALSLALLASPLGAQIDATLLAGLKARSIGPAAMSGRVGAVEAVASNPDILYVGAASGGVWKSTDGALTWKAIFDDQPVASIGAIAVHPRQTDIVWVGTGEGNPRNSASVGNGIYRSADGGETWTHLGLEETERIHRIVLHPTDPDTAYVAALGKTWGGHPQRGVFKTSDGGKTWKKVLYVNDTTGAADLIMDPRNPHKLFAALWQHRRWPWFFESGGPGSGLYVSHDSGETWQALTPEDGLPKGRLGRIGLALAPSDPQVVYALVEAEEANVFLRSQDGGKTWKERSNTEKQEIGNRPFYYSDIRVDPADPGRVYSLHSVITLTEDGGASWRVLVPFGAVHPDHHALWIDPANANFLINGNDGGVYLSRDRGETWRFVRNLPFAQFYHLRVDGERPFNVYGGLQDNGSWKGPSAVWESGGIRDYHWQEVNFGDGFDTVPDPRDPTQGYAMSQEGFLVRWNMKTGERKVIRPAPAPQVPPVEEGLRFNWNAAIALDPFEPDTLYFGSQQVHRSRDRGDTWEVISPDLTTNNPEWQKQLESGGLTPDVTGAENFTSILTLAPSPLEAGILWAGTDDGRIHVTRDGGANWSSVEGNVPGVPAHTWVPKIEASRFDPAEAFAVFDDHRRAGWQPYVYRTRDFGKTWKSLVTKDLRGYALTLVQDPVDRDLLFLGTEFGLFFSIDGGGSWLPFRHGVPTVSVMALAIQARDSALAIGTHGRGAFIVDDLQPFRDLTPETLKQPLHLFPAPPAQQVRIRQTGSSRFPGHGEFRGENLSYGARLLFSLSGEDLPHPDKELEKKRLAARRAAEAGAAKVSEKDGKDGKGDKQEKEDEGEDDKPKATLEIFDSQGQRLRTLKLPVHQGLNRAVWDLSMDAFKSPPKLDKEEEQEGEDQDKKGPEVPPGVYRARLSFLDQSAETEIQVLADPRFDISPEARQARWQAQLRAGRLQEITAEALERLLQVRQDVDTATDRLKARKKERERRQPTQDPQPEDSVLEAAKTLKQNLETLEKRLWTPPKTKGYTGEATVLDRLGRAKWFLESGWDAPTPAQQAYLDRAEALLKEVLPDLQRFFQEELPPFRRQLEEADARFLPDLPVLVVEGGVGN